MENLTQTNTNFLLDISVEDLHKRTKEWLSEIELWRIELKFFQNLLEKITFQVSSLEERKKADKFQNLIMYYSFEILDHFQHEIFTQERYLNSLIQNKDNFNDQSYRNIFKDYERRVGEFSGEFRKFKKELYEFVEHLV